MSVVSTSVVIAVHNGEPHLGEALASVTAQTVAPLEVIVVDDGSRDRSAAVAREQGATVISQPRRGVAAARNRGVAAASGEAIAFLDADDLWEPGKLAIQSGALAADPALGIVRCHLRAFLSAELDAAAAAAIHVPAEPQPGVMASAITIRRTAWERVGPLAEQRRFGETLAWVLAARSLGVGELIQPDVLVRRRIHATNTTRSQAEALSDYAFVLKEELDRRRAAAADPAGSEYGG